MIIKTITEKKGRLSLFFSSQSGFSLVEAAIGLMVLGAITSGMLATYNSISQHEKDIKTRGNLNSLEASLNSFYVNGEARYPCPAALNSKEGDVNYGQEGNCTLSSIKLCSDLSWKTSEGICKTDNTVNAVIIGAVPHSALKISYNESLDIWGNKIIYAVTHQQTNSSTFESHTGAITVMTMDDPSLPYNAGNTSQDQIPDARGFTDPPDIFLFSTGDNGVGGFTKDGVALADCGLASTGIETENCDFDAVFLSENDPDYSGGARSLNPGVTYFDDLTIYKLGIRESIWFPQPSFDDDVLTLAKNVGIGTTLPQYALEVVGNIYAPNEVRSKAYCDNDLNNCFDPESITGTKAVMTCNSDTSFGSQAVLRLAYSRVYCSSPVDKTTGSAIGGDPYTFDMSKFTVIDCMSSGKLMAGFDELGKPICKSP